MHIETQSDFDKTILTDLHVHSKHSTRPSQWVLQKLNCPECFTEPQLIYDRAKKQGMNLVTISDHNTIAGSLEIAHYNDVFISEEVTTYFPEDRCKLHVLVLNLDEALHRDIQKLRENVYDLVDYLNGKDILHILAHPLYDMNHLLTWTRLEQLLLLFRYFELNGAREPDQNDALQQIVAQLDASTIERLADKHGMRPRHERPWIKFLVGGSDDHSSLNIARMHTRVHGAHDVPSFLHALALGNCSPVGTPASPRTMAHNLYGIAYQFYRSKFPVGDLIAREPIMQFADCILTGKASREDGLRDRLPSLLSLRKVFQSFSGKEATSILDLVLDQARSLMESRPDILRKAGEKPGDCELEHDWFDMVNSMASRMSAHFTETIIDSLAGAKLFNIFQTLGSAGTIYSLLAPYFVAYSIFSRDRQFSEHCLAELRAEEFNGSTDFKLAVFTDTFSEMNGVALTLKQQLAIARDKGFPFFILTCGQDQPGTGVINFPSQGTFSLPEYPEQELHYPPLLEILDACYQQRFTHILASTPGPLGLAALWIGRVLKLPVYATYHTAIPQYVLERTGDRDMEELVWKGMIWYYNQMEAVFVPSESIAAELIERGLAKEKVEVYPRGIDTAQFKPTKRNGFWKGYFPDSEQTIKLLYVGRISKEKNLDMLVQAYRRHLSERSDLKLIFVGDGPDMERIRLQLPSENVVFTGQLEGEDLAQAYASSDIFVFPSCTDTFGNVVLEAQASGLPVIVTDRGGPMENMVHGQTGFVVPAHDCEALARAVSRLADDAELLQTMKRRAHDFCQSRSFESAFLNHWEMYKRPRQAA